MKIKFFVFDYKQQLNLNRLTKTVGEIRDVTNEYCFTPVLYSPNEVRFYVHYYEPEYERDNRNE